MKKEWCVIWFDYDCRTLEYVPSGKIEKNRGIQLRREYLEKIDAKNTPRFYGYAKLFPIVKYFEKQQDATRFAGVEGWRLMQGYKKEDRAIFEDNKIKEG